MDKNGINQKIEIKGTTEFIEKVFRSLSGVVDSISSSGGTFETLSDGTKIYISYSKREYDDPQKNKLVIEIEDVSGKKSK